MSILTDSQRAAIAVLVRDGWSTISIVHTMNRQTVVTMIRKEESLTINSSGSVKFKCKESNPGE